jgi:hypothetical protein
VEISDCGVIPSIIPKMSLKKIRKTRKYFKRDSLIACRNINQDRVCGLVFIVLGYRSGGPGSIPGTTRKKSSGSGTGSTHPREYN